MRVLLALNSSEKEEEKIVQTYKEKYGETLEVTSVYFFKSLIDTVKKSSPFDRIVIHENLEPTGRKNKDVFDEFIFKNMDSLTDIDDSVTIIFLCGENRRSDDVLLNKLFNMGVYNILIGSEGTFSKVCELIKKPMTKKDAKRILEVNTNADTYEDPNKVSEIELRNILEYYEKNINDKEKIIAGFDKNLYEQYTIQKLKVIITFLPAKVRDILYVHSDKYRAVLGEVVKIVEVPVYMDENNNIVSVSTNTIINPAAAHTVTIKSNGSTSVSDLGAATAGDETKTKKGLFGFLKKDKNADNVVSPMSDNTITIKQTVPEPKMVAPKPFYTQEKFNLDNDITPNTKLETKSQIDNEINNILKDNSKEEARKEVTLNEPTIESISNIDIEPKVEPITVPEYNIPTININIEQVPEIKVEESIEVPEIKVEEPIEVPEIKVPEQLEIKNEVKEEELPEVKEEIKEEKTLPEYNIPTININIEQVPEIKVEESIEVPEIKIEESIEIPEIKVPEQLEIKNEVKEEELPEVKVEKALPEYNIPSVNINIEQMPEVKVEEYIEIPESKEPEQLEIKNEEKQEELPEVRVEVVEEKALPEININIDKVQEAKLDKPLGRLPELKLEESPNDVTNSFATIDIPKAPETDNFTVPEMKNNDMPKLDIPVYNEPAVQDFAEKKEALNTPQIQTVTQVIEREVIKHEYETPSDYKKAIAFIGPHKSGTTFIINAIASNLISKGIKTAILDLTKNKDTYKIYAANSSEYREIAGNSIPNLAIGQDVPLQLGDLSIYTGVPRVDRTKLDPMKVLEKIRNENAVILIDCDFTTNVDIFRLVNNIFVVQDMDITNVLDITSFLNQLKVSEVNLDKVEVIVNKHMKSILSAGRIVESLSYHTNPEMTFVNELLPKTVKRFIVSFDEQNYLRYIECLYSAKLNFEGFSEQFKQEIMSIVYEIFPISSSVNVSQQQEIIQPNNNSKLKGMFKKKK